MANSSHNDITECASKLVSAYPEELEASIEDELIQFSALMKIDIAQNVNSDKSRESQYYVFLKEHKLESSFPNIKIVLRIYYLRQKKRDTRFTS